MRRHPSRRGGGNALAPPGSEGDAMRYLVAWILGVPLGVIALWFVVGHTACR
jgi:hypothetical protein